MRVLFWTFPAAFQAPGGGETILLKTREYLQRLGVQVDLFDQWTTKLTDYPLVHCFHSVYPEFWESVRDSGRRLVVTPTHWPTMDPKIRAWRRLKRAGRDLLRLPGPHRDTAYYYSLADAILPSSQVELELLRRYCSVPRGKMTVVRNGVEPRFVGASPEPFVERYGLRDFVLSVARFTPNKNQLHAIRALKSCDVPLVFVGTPDPDAADYFAQCRREAGPHVHFIGWIDHDSALLPSAFAAARVFLLPSTRELAPVSAMEAAAAGCRLVVTPAGSTREYYGDSAHYVDPASEADIRDKTLAALARGRANEAPWLRTWTDVAKEVLAVYEDLLARKT